MIKNITVNSADINKNADVYNECSMTDKDNT